MMDYEYHFPVDPPVFRTPQPVTGKYPITGSENTNMETTVLFGADLRRTNAPRETLADRNHPLVRFVNDERNQAFGLSDALLSKHLLLLGGIGSGKTNVINFIVRSLISRITTDDIVLIFDSKGDYFQKFYNNQNPNHLVIGNQPAYENMTAYWNIFDELRNDSGRFDKRSEITAKEISRTLFAGRESDTQPFFAQAAADLVAKVLIHFIRHRPNDLNNSVLVSFFRTANVSAYHDILDQNPDFESARDYIGMRGTKLTAQALGVLSYVTTMVNDIFIGIFGEGTSSNTFSMRNLIRRKGRKIVFIEYDLSEGEILSPLYGLMYDLALKQALGGREFQGKTYLICDEFRILPKLNHIGDALNLGRSLGVRVVAGLQTMNQLYDVYGDVLGKTIAAGFMNSFCFRTWDLDSREFISDRMGKTYINYSFDARGTPISTQREGRVAEDWDLLSLRVGEAIVNLSDFPPFRFRFDEFV